MSFGVVEGSAGGTSGADVTSHVVNLPSGIQADEQLLAVVVFDGNPTTVTWPDAWVAILDYNNGSAVSMAIAYKIATGTEGASISVTTSSAERSVHRTFRCSGLNVVNPFVCYPFPTTGTSTSPDPGPFSPTGATQDFLCIALAGHDDGTATVSGYPTGFANGTDTNDGNASGVGLGDARADITNVTINPDAFTLSASKPWIASVVAGMPRTVGIGEFTWTTVYERDWPTLKTGAGCMTPEYYGQSPSQGTDPMDADYPEIVEAEAVKTVSAGGRNVLDADDSVYGHPDAYFFAGVSLDQIGPDGARPPVASPPNQYTGFITIPSGRAYADYKLVNQAWVDGGNFGFYPIFWCNRTVFDNEQIGLSADFNLSGGTQVLLEFTYQSWLTGNVSYNSVRLNKADFVDRRIRFQVTWRCGTEHRGTNVLNDVDSDGWIQVSLIDLDTMDETVVYHFMNIPLYISYQWGTSVTLGDEPNQLAHAFLGFAGLFGQNERFVIQKFGGDPQPRFPPTIPCCGPSETEKRKCCERGGGGGEGTVEVGESGSLLSPISPIWTMLCAGGGEVPLAADLSDAEDWDQ